MRGKDVTPFLPAHFHRETQGPSLEANVRLVLRNGFTLEDALTSVGPYDLVLGSPGGEVLVPLHALLSWEALQDGPELPSGV